MPHACFYMCVCVSACACLYVACIFVAGKRLTLEWQFFAAFYNFTILFFIFSFLLLLLMYPF